MTHTHGSYDHSAYVRARRDALVRAVDDAVLAVVALMHRYDEAWCADCFWEMFAEPLYRAVMSSDRDTTIGISRATGVPSSGILAAIRAHLDDQIMTTDIDCEGCGLPWMLWITHRGDIGGD